MTIDQHKIILSLYKSHDKDKAQECLDSARKELDMAFVNQTGVTDIQEYINELNDLIFN